MLNGFTIKGNNSLLVINVYASSNCGHCEVSLCFEKNKTKTRMKKKSTLPMGFGIMSSSDFSARIPRAEV